MIKVCAISDCHGDLPEINPCNLLLICGDSVPLNIQASNKGTKKWYKNEFTNWALDLPCDKVLFIAGNHDLRLEGHKIIYENIFPFNNKITYLCHKEYTYTHDGIDYKIFGTPYCHMFGNWAFMYLDSELEKIFNNIPNNLDILMTHDAPYGVSDVLLQPEYYNGNHIGSKPLANAIIDKNPKIVCHGHLHSTSREFESLGNSKVINCSIKDERYNISYNPIYFEI